MDFWQILPIVHISNVATFRSYLQGSRTSRTKCLQVLQACHEGIHALILIRDTSELPDYMYTSWGFANDCHTWHWACLTFSAQVLPQGRRFSDAWHSWTVIRLQAPSQWSYSDGLQHQMLSHSYHSLAARTVMQTYRTMLTSNHLVACRCACSWCALYEGAPSGQELVAWSSA